MNGNHHTKALTKLITDQAHTHGVYDVFRDFVEVAACSISCAIDPRARDEREKCYQRLMAKYKPDQQQAFPHMLAELTMALEVEPGDVLGHVFGALELGNKRAGQFFTPDSISRLIGDMTVGDGEEHREKIAERGYVTLFEPAVGAGAMVISYAEAMRAAGINYQQHLHVTAIDVDPRAVHMAYVQFSLLGIPALVIRGNAITLEEREHWYTPAHVMGLWDVKLRRGYALGSAMDRDAQSGHEPAQPGQAELFPVEKAA